MSGPKADAILSRVAPKKKKKRKAGADPSSSTSWTGAIIQDDDAGWGNAFAIKEDEDRRVTGAGGAGEDSGWTTVRERTPPAPEDEQPMVVDEKGVEPEPFKGGLLTSKQLRERMAAANKGSGIDERTREEIEAAQETVYRDVSGRKIDTNAEKAEAARRKREKEERDAKKMEWGKGLVQREEEEEQKKELERQRTRDVARYADDVDLNKELKAQERWNDPAAAFLTKIRSKGPRKPEYTGPPPPPNRFGLKPGYRWDGVDRGNGFEKKLFQRQNERKRRGQESYEWSVDDM
ncbi:hypothetical protein EW146_g9414 [Bondarzewia mesenterica]|uniref:Pre-mRNA-splicing factor CWC26 n=1 Tax=Bondarzewia mesenterica TaxID=1095465 RepID=A0A4S4L6V0_9AGAM|nr:hypothetical protein EW146_g9414 [Bondarzewia mesenterica]